MEITKEEYADWKRNPVTKLLFKYLEDQIRQAEITLGTSAGLNQMADRHMVGGIDCCKEVLDWNPVREQEEDTTDGN